MKRCTYCGTEYPDDATVCVIDRTPLEDPIVRAQEKVGDTANISSGARQEDLDVVYPEYQWSAKDGWKFLGMILVFDLLWYVVMEALFWNFRSYAHWRVGPYGAVVMHFLFVAMNILIAAYFARTETIVSFCKATGLDRKPTHYAWFGVAAAFGIRLISHIFHVLGWARGYRDWELDIFRHSHERTRYLYLIPLLLAAFWEEPVIRGFGYKAFRGSYSIGASIGIILVYTAYAHWNQYAHLGFAVISLSALTVVQCYLREKSDSIWDCILCHLTFNGSMLFVSGLFR
jgi:membrane protease YdiL (CAAX protease family)